MSPNYTNSDLLKLEIEDLIFNIAFASQENLSEIYEAFLPEEKIKYLPEDFIIINLNTSISNGLREDLFFYNTKTNTLILLVIEPFWKISLMKNYMIDVINTLGTLFFEYDDLIDITTPKIEFFVLDIGRKTMKQKTYQMFDALNREYIDGKDIGNWKVNMISKNNDNIPQSKLIEDLFKYNEKRSRLIEEMENIREAAETLVEECIQEDIFADFIKENKQAVIDNTIELFCLSAEEEGYRAGARDKASEIFTKLLENGVPEDLARKITEQ